MPATQKLCPATQYSYGHKQSFAKVIRLPSTQQTLDFGNPISEQHHCVKVVKPGQKPPRHRLVHFRITRNTLHAHKHSLPLSSGLLAHREAMTPRKLAPIRAIDEINRAALAVLTDPQIRDLENTPKDGMQRRQGRRELRHGVHMLWRRARRET